MIIITDTSKSEWDDDYERKIDLPNSGLAKSGDTWIFRGSWWGGALIIIVLCVIPPLAVLAFILAMVLYQVVLP